MTRPRRAAPADLIADPFRERSANPLREDFRVLGGLFHFETASAKLLQLARTAFAGLPVHRLSRRVPRFRVRLELIPAGKAHRAPGEPLPLTLLSGLGYLCGATAPVNLMLVSPSEHKALLAISSEMARFAYHTRYELIEFAVYVLASRAQGLVSLHAGCVGLGNRGVLLIGPSGSGKSTLVLHCLLDGFDVVSEDSALVAPETLRATGLANFLHLRRDGLRFLAGSSHASRFAKAPVIRRRSGVQKLEVDLRQIGARLADAPVQIAAVVFITGRSVDEHGALLLPIRKADLVARLRETQTYAVSNPGWRVFERNVSRLPSFELRRGRHPLESARALRDFLAGPAR